MNPEACNINFPPLGNPIDPVVLPGQTYGKFIPSGYRMTQDQIAEFGKWLKENEPALKDEGDYWELFAYRIVAKLGV